MKMYGLHLRFNTQKNGQKMDEQEDLKGLGGWLIIVGIGTVISPFYILYAYGSLYYDIFTNGTFEYVTTPGTELYSPLLGPLIIGEAVYNALMVIVSFYMIYLFFTKHYLFPRVFITVMVVSAVFIPLDAWVSSLVFPDEPMFDPETTKEFVRSLVGVFIWVPYILISKRVEATFVEQTPERETDELPEVMS